MESLEGDRQQRSDWFVKRKVTREGEKDEVKMEVVGEERKLKPQKWTNLVRYIISGFGDRQGEREREGYS